MKYLKVFTDFADKLELLGDAERGRLFTAMLKYAESGAEPELKGNERFLWATAKADIDRQRESYDKRCETNKQIATNRYQDAPKSTKRNETCQDKDKEKEKKKNNIPPIPPQGEQDEDLNTKRFDSFWSVYPKKTAKKDARKAWDKLKVDNELYTLIMKNLMKQTKSQDWSKENGKYVPYPATWLNGHRWEDEVEVSEQVTPTERPKYEKLTLRR